MPEGYLEQLEYLAHPNDPSKTSPQALSEEVKILFNTTRQTIKQLLEIEAQPWVWDVTLIFEEWQSQEQSALKAYILPPMKYQVRIEARSPTAEWSCILTPAELRVITMINPDLGRRIGDELDGRKPSDD